MKKQVCQRGTAGAQVAGIVWIALLTAFPSAASDGIRHGLTLCGELLIPSLFPTLLAASLLMRSGAIQHWGRILHPVTRRLWGLPGCSGAVFLLSMLGGYPIGARCIRQLTDDHCLTPGQGALLLHFCVGTGPGFAVSVVGCGLFGSLQMGLLLWGCQMLAAFLLSLTCRSRDCSAPDAPAPEPADSILVATVRDASAGILNLCGWVLAFCSFRAFLSLLPLPRGAEIAVDLLSEVTTGVRTARVLGSPVLAAFVLGWGGLCVHAQILSAGVRCRCFLLYRALHGILAALLTAAFLPLMPFSDVLPAFRPVGTAVTAVHTPFSLALLALVSVFLLQLPLSIKNKKISQNSGVLHGFML
jgi:spore maturation protein SpmB